MREAGVKIRHNLTLSEVPDERVQNRPRVRATVSGSNRRGIKGVSQSDNKTVRQRHLRALENPNSKPKYGCVYGPDKG